MKSSYLNLAYLGGENQAGEVDKPIYRQLEVKSSNIQTAYLLVRLTYI